MNRILNHHWVREVWALFLVGKMNPADDSLGYTILLISTSSLLAFLSHLQSPASMAGIKKERKVNRMEGGGQGHIVANDGAPKVLAMFSFLIWCWLLATLFVIM